jgi:hypothetical protein
MSTKQPKNSVAVSSCLSQN